jgi:hypothetical protein
MQTHKVAAQAEHSQRGMGMGIVSLGPKSLRKEVLWHRLIRHEAMLHSLARQTRSPQTKE